jgi:phospholipase C
MGVSHGEELIARVHNALISNPRVFAKSLLLIVYDEHGGFYDHVVPPGHRGWNAAAPAIDHAVVRPDGPDSPEGYDFTTLGPRVPAVVVSPWIERGSTWGWSSVTEKKTFDHTSILATVGAMTGRWVHSPRARAATPLDVTLNRATPRSDASKLVFKGGDYAPGPVDAAKAAAAEPSGVAKELCDAYRAEHAKDATPEQIAAYYESLVQ